MNKKILFVLLLLLSPLLSLAIPIPPIFGMVESSTDIYRDQSFPGLTWNTDDGIEAEGWSTVHYQFTLDGDVYFWDDNGNRINLPRPIFPNPLTRIILYENSTHVAVRYLRKTSALFMTTTKLDVWFYYDFSRTDEYGYSSEVKLIIEIVKYDKDLPLKIRLENPGEYLTGESYRSSKWVDERWSEEGVLRYKRQFWVEQVEDDVICAALAFDWSDILESYNPRLIIRDSCILLDVQEGDVIDPTTIGTCTSSLALYTPMQRKSFYINGRYWIFYCDGSDIVYRTNTSATTWSASTVLLAGETSSVDFSVWANATEFAYVHINDTEQLNYRLGTPQAGGTINWVAPEQTAYANAIGANLIAPTVCFNVSGHPWVAWYSVGTTGWRRAQTTSSPLADGTWIPGLPVYNLSTTSSTYVSVVPLSAGAVYFVWSHGWGVADPYLRGKEWIPGPSFGLEEVAVVAGYGLEMRSGFSVTSNGTYVFVASLVNTTNFIDLFVRDPVAWLGPPYTAHSATTSTSMPIATYDSTGDNIYVFWMGHPLADHIYYNIYNLTTMVMEYPTNTGYDWVTETQGLTLNYALTGPFDDSGSTIGVYHLSTMAPPYNVRFDSVIPVVPGAPAGWLPGGWDYRRRKIIWNNTLAANNYTFLVKVLYDDPTDEDMLNYTGLSGGWNTSFNVPQIPLGAPAAWDESMREQGNIIYDPSDSGKEYKILYTGYDGPNDGRTWVGGAYSTDLVTWTKTNRVRNDVYLEDPYLVLWNNTYYMWSEKKDAGGNQDDIVCLSTNDFTSNAWTNHGKVLEKLGVGWESTDVDSPVVWRNDTGTWYMLYEGRGPGESGDIGLANNTDAAITGVWTREGKVIDDTDFPYVTAGDAIVPNDIVIIGNRIWFLLGFYTGAAHGSKWRSNMVYSTNVFTTFTEAYSSPHWDIPHLFALRNTWSTLPRYVTNYQNGGINIGYLDEGLTIDLGGKSNADFSDIRFTQSDGTTLLYHNMEENLTSEYAEFRVRIGNIAVANYTIYMYYGNVGAADGSRPSGTYAMYDDFEAANVSAAWTAVNAGAGCSYSIDPTTAGHGNKSLKFVDGSGVNIVYISKSGLVGDDFYWRLWFRQDSADTGDTAYWWFGDDDLNRQTNLGYNPGDADAISYYIVAWNIVLVINVNTWYMLEMTHTASGNKYNIDINGRRYEIDVGLRPLDPGDDLIRMQTSSGGTLSVWWDEVIVRKVVYDTEPYGSLWLNEEPLVAGNTPTIDNITSSETDVYPGDYFYISVDADDADADITIVDLAVGAGAVSVTFRYNNLTDTHSIQSDPFGVATLDVAGSSVVNINATAIRPIWRVMFSAAYGNGNKNASAIVTDSGARTGNNFQADLFFFHVGAGAIVFSAEWHSTTIAGELCRFNITVTTNASDFKWAKLGHNASGLWVNETKITITGMAANITDTQILPPTAGTKIHYRWYARLLVGDWEASAMYSFKTSTAGDTSVITILAYTNPVAFTFQRKGFYGSQHWIIYSDGTNEVYRVSDDGVVWSDAVIIGPVGPATGGYYYSFWFNHSTHTIEYARVNTTIGAGTLYYRKGTAESDGNITWVAAEQTVLAVGADERPLMPTIGVDTDGYPWIGYSRDNTTSLEAFLFVTKSSRNDGIWATDLGFPRQMSIYNGTYNPAIPQVDQGRVIVVPLLATKMYILYGWGHTGWNGTLYDAGWGADENITALWMPNSDTSGQSATNIGDIVFFGLYRNNGEMYLFNRTVGGVWANQLVVAGLVGTASPIISAVGNVSILIFWKASNHIWYRRYDLLLNMFSDTYDLVNEESDKLHPSADIAAFYMKYDSIIGVTYLTRLAAPYILKYAFLVFHEPGITDITLTNPDGCGMWVTVGRISYEFLGEFVVFDANNFRAGIGFFDFTGRWYSVVYESVNRSSISLTSPDDGISASVDNVTITSTNTVYIHYRVMFNPPIADTYDVDMYSMLVDPMIDTGWIIDTVAYFNIYNLGGLADLNSSGWAGRLTGGDVFEIYAADTRVDKMFNESFEEDPYFEYIWIYGVLTLVQRSKDLQWIIRDNFPYSNITLMESYPRAGSHQYAYTGASRNPTWRDGSQGLRVATTDSVDYIPMAIKKFRRPIRALAAPGINETVRVEVWWQSILNETLTTSTSRLVVSDIPTYRGGAMQAMRLHMSSGIVVGPPPTTGVVEWGLFGGPVRLDATWTVDTWYNITAFLNMTSQSVVQLYWNGVPTNATGLPFYDAGSVTRMEYFEGVGSDGAAPPGPPCDVVIDHVVVTTDWDGNYGGEAKALTTHRNLQHWHMDWDFGVEEGYVTQDEADLGFIELGWDICLNDTWENDFLVARINITAGVDPNSEFWYKTFRISKQNWVEFNITWYQHANPKRTNVLKNDTLYGLYEGYGIESTPGANDVIGWYWDMWFNRINASSVVGGRLNCEWFGMANKHPWPVIGSDWQPMIYEETQSTCFVDLTDNATKTIHSVKDVEMIRSWVRVFRDNVSTFHYKVKNIQEMSFEVVHEMQGIDTPPIKKTQIPVMGGGFFGSFFGAIMKRVMTSLADAITMGAMTVWTYFVGFMDAIFGFFGFAGFIPMTLSVAVDMFGFMMTLITEGYIVNILGIFFIFITSTFGHLIFWFARVTDTFVSIFSIVWQIIDGTYAISTGVGNMWTLMNWNEWADAMPIFMIIAWFSSLDSRHRKAGGGWFMFFLTDLQILFTILSFFLTLMMGIIEFVLNIIFRIIDSIPVIE